MKQYISISIPAIVMTLVLGTASFFKYAEHQPEEMLQVASPFQSVEITEATTTLETFEQAPIIKPIVTSPSKPTTEATSTPKTPVAEQPKPAQKSYLTLSVFKYFSSQDLADANNESLTAHENEHGVIIFDIGMYDGSGKAFDRDLLPQLIIKVTRYGYPRENHIIDSDVPEPIRKSFFMDNKPVEAAGHRYYTYFPKESGSFEFTFTTIDGTISVSKTLDIQ